jgi:predicted membrane channel-forming protein YqfA (hemolysin III family)
VIIVGRWKTTSYIPGFRLNADDAKLRADQERPWFWLLVFFALFGVMPLAKMATDDQLSRATIYLCNAVFGVFAVLGLIEGLRKVRFWDPKFWA